ncbi:MAG TPA: hypothetical protein VKP61_08515 [Candidatus Acidoferrum sp.]|nr:hypothetical protein [Candidatus Acidoferrum sp.]
MIIDPLTLKRNTGAALNRQLYAMPQHFRAQRNLNLPGSHLVFRPWGFTLERASAREESRAASII